MNWFTHVLGISVLVFQSGFGVAIGETLRPLYVDIVLPVWIVMTYECTHKWYFREQGYRYSDRNTLKRIVSKEPSCANERFGWGLLNSV